MNNCGTTWLVLGRSWLRRFYKGRTTPKPATCKHFAVCRVQLLIVVRGVVFGLACRGVRLERALLLRVLSFVSFRFVSFFFSFFLCSMYSSCESLGFAFLWLATRVITARVPQRNPPIGFHDFFTYVFNTKVPSPWIFYIACRFEGCWKELCICTQQG